MKTRTIVAAALLMVGRTWGQVWTMDDCIRYALAHAASVQKRQVEANTARADVGIALSDFLPSVGASTTAQYSWGRNVDPETNTYNTVTTFNNYYSLYASLQVFDGGQTINRFRQARLLRRQSQSLLQQAQDEKAIEVMQKYVDAVYAWRCVELAEEKLSESRQLLVKTRRMEELGIKSLPDVAQVESQVAEDDYGLTHGQNQYQAAMLALRSAMNLPAGDSLSLEQPHATEPDGQNLPWQPGLPAAMAADQGLRAAQLGYQISKGRLLPSLSIQAGVSTSYFRNLHGGTTASPFHSQFTGNMGEYVYATLSLPVFEYARYQNVRKARHSVQLARIERDETLRRLSDEARQAVMDCEGYGKEVEKMGRKVDADSLAYHLSARKYEEGMLSTFDLHTASQTLHESRIRLLQAQLLYVIRQRLVEYYKGKSLWIR